MRALAESGDVIFGNIDTFLLWNLTGGTKGGIHVTDVTNASRTQLMNLETLAWDEEILSLFGIPAAMLPRIVSSSEVYGHVAAGPLAGVPLAGDLGDQQAALVGQTCFEPGQAKNTYGTGCFLLLNTDRKPVQSKFGLLTTVAYQFGKQPAHYALEGSVAITGALVQWLRDNLNLIRSSAEIETLARQVDDNGGVYFVPAFSGLYAPYWKSSARGVICGLTRYANKAHIARAVLEATAFQTREVVEAMEKDSGIRARRPAHRWRHGRQRIADAVPGGHPRSSGGAPGDQGDDRAGRDVCGRTGGGLLPRPRRPAGQLVGGQDVEAEHGGGEARAHVSPCGRRQSRAASIGWRTDVARGYQSARTNLRLRK